VIEMPNVNVSYKWVGRRLLSDVRSAFNGIIYEKGHQLTDQDIEFLEAFRISTIHIDESDTGQAKEEQEKEKEGERKGKTVTQVESFQTQYDLAVAYMEKLMINVAGGASIPVMEIRGWLKPLVELVSRPSGWVMALQPVHHSHKYTYHHCVGVALIAAMIARANRFAENEIMQIALAGLLSDIGKAKIDSEILLKAGSLTTQEFQEMKQHTVIGYQTIKGTPGLSKGVALAALQHHEREDGSGYPLGIKGNHIHPYAKIVAIADVFHAMCSLRTYKQKESPIRVLEYIRYENVGRFDPGMVHAFMRSITQLPLGTRIRLNDERLGKIIYVDPTHPTRPTVEVGGQIIPLIDHKDLYIQEIILGT